MIRDFIDFTEYMQKREEFNTKLRDQIKRNKEEEKRKLLPRFLLEKYGRVTVATEEDMKEFNDWVFQLGAYNSEFANILKAEGMVQECEDVTEVVTSTNHSVSNKLRFYYIEKEFITGNYGMPLALQATEPYSGNHIIINGIYENMDSYLKQAVCAGGFSAGIVTGKNNRLLEAALIYYRTLAGTLTQRDFGDMEFVPTIIERDTDSTKTFVLHSTLQPKQK